MARALASDLIRKHQEGRKLVCLTAYDAPTAAAVEAAGVDFILVGDSMANAALALRDTRCVTLEMTIHHTAAVVRGTESVHVCADMPFGSYQISPEDAKRSVARVVAETGCQSVKIEGGRPRLATVEAILELGVPVLGHVGYTPQSVGLRPSRRAMGDQEAEMLLTEAWALQEAGCFAVVLEMVPRMLAKEITDRLDIATIGIGSGPHCGGQVLVFHDMMGMGPDLRHSKRYADLETVIREGAAAYVSEVRSGAFPAEEHGFD